MIITCLKHIGFYVIFFCGIAVSLIAGAAEIEVVDRIVAIVNNDIVSLVDLEQMMKPYMGKIRSSKYPPEKRSELMDKLREDVLNQLISQKLTDQESRRAGIVVSEKEVDNAVNRIKEENFYSDKELKAALGKEGLSIEDYRNRMREQIVRSRLVSMEVKSKVVITRDEIKAYYESHQEEYQGGKKYRLRNIVLKIPSPDDQEGKAKIGKKMEMILAKLKKGEPFDKTARQYSEAPSAAEGGNLGEIDHDVLAPQLQETFKDMKSGQLTPVLDTDQGYQIFLIEEVIEGAGKSLEEASPEIEDKLFQEIVNKKFQSWLEDLRKRSHIKIIR